MPHILRVLVTFWQYLSMSSEFLWHFDNTYRRPQSSCDILTILMDDKHRHKHKSLIFNTYLYFSHDVSHNGLRKELSIYYRFCASTLFCFCFCCIFTILDQQMLYALIRLENTRSYGVSNIRIWYSYPFYCLINFVAIYGFIWLFLHTFGRSFLNSLLFTK